jgi:hypothetical protein
MALVSSINRRPMPIGSIGAARREYESRSEFIEEAPLPQRGDHADERGLLRLRER